MINLPRCNRIVLIFLLTVFLAACSPLFFWPDSLLRQTPNFYGLHYDEVILTSNNGELLYGWYVRADELKSTTPRGVIYYLYGNAQNMSAHFQTVVWLVEHGWEIFTFDYRGYGRSTGAPDIPGIHQDVEVGLGWATSKAAELELPLVVLGQSLGASAAITILGQAENPVIDALILDSPFSGYRQMVREKMQINWLTWLFAIPASWTVPDRYSPIRHMGELPRIPILILHGCSDRVTPCEHSKSLAEAAERPVTLWKDPKADHTVMLLSPQWQKKVLEWLDSKLSIGTGF